MRAIFQAGGIFCKFLVGHAIGAAAARCPFAHDTQGASETFGLQAAPEFGSIAAARVPQVVQQWQICVSAWNKNPVGGVIGFQTEPL
jgi:hypothetical protein